MIVDPLSGACVSYSTQRDSTTPPIHWPPHATVTMTQPHSNQVRVVTTTDETQSLDCDGIITSTKSLHLQVKTADCLPILLFHPSGVVGAIHAGRKGTQLGILRAALQLLKKRWAVTSNLKIWFGPAICADCYQIDRKSDTHYDLITENAKQLYSEFAPGKVALKVARCCTAHEPTNFYSYRREGPGVPMNYSGIMLP